MKINGLYTDSNGRPIDQFELEQKIMEAWHIVEDLRLAYSRLEEMSEDQVYGTIHGLEIFADMRFQSLWDTFEQCMHNGVFKNVNNRNAKELTKTLDETSQGFGQEQI